jgi:hypothetical protein
MERTDIHALARVLRRVVSVLIVLNIAALWFVPMGVLFQEIGLPSVLEHYVLTLLGIKPLGEDDIQMSLLLYSIFGWSAIFGNIKYFLYSAFFLLCGCCTLILLRQGRNILDTVLAGDPFRVSNARSLKRAAMSCWIVSVAAVVRLVAELLCYRNTQPLYAYNTLFAPAFLVAGLLLMVMSALFGQAAQMQEEQDLTI